jgi:hypothetical protein
VEGEDGAAGGGGKACAGVAVREGGRAAAFGAKAERGGVAAGATVGGLSYSGAMRLAAALVTRALLTAACGSDPEPAHEITRQISEAATWNAAAWCRTTTCAADPGWDGIRAPGSAACEPAGHFEECKANGNPDVPLWWRPSCVGYDLQASASWRVPYDTFANIAASAYQAWTSKDCTRAGRVSIDARDLGPITCAQIGYDPSGPNHNVILFRDAFWPHKTDEEIAANAPSPTIALTTVTFDSWTGEIFDADLEINSADHEVMPLVAPQSGRYDLQAVLTHEIGHFFGMAHSTDPKSVMFSSDEGDDLSKRALGASDIAGVCSVYRPDGMRSVSTEIEPSGLEPTSGCDPTPRHGYTAECSESKRQHGCAMAPGQERGERGASLVLLALAALVARSRAAQAGTSPDEAA